MLLGLGAAASAVVLAGCGAAARAPTSTPGTATPAPAGVTVSVSKPGGFLIDGKGHALYLFAADKTNTSACYSACASIWPPLTTSGAVKPGASVLASELGTTKRTGGANEVTYHGHPLYLYVGDATAGQTSGQGLLQFGARWYLVAPNGERFTGDAG